MNSCALSFRVPSTTALWLAIVAGVLSSWPAIADDAGVGVNVRGSAGHYQGSSHHHGAVGYGTLGYSGPGIFPGYYGFGLSFHLGYGYGGRALGVGAFGGYPFYGGPGYPHPAPPLRRCGKEEPFSYYDGLGFPYAFAAPVGLVVNPDVVTEGNPLGTGLVTSAESGFSRPGDYGAYTGALPYPDGFFSPFTAAAAAGRGGAAGSSRPGAAGGTTPTAREFGIDEELVVDVGGTLAVKVLRVYPGTAAEEAGLQVGDIILSVNGYLTERPGHLGWIMANAARDNALTMNVRKASDGKTRTITARVPVKPASAAQPPERPTTNAGEPPQSP
jgi:hypothetical protein